MDIKYLALVYLCTWT